MDRQAKDNERKTNWREPQVGFRRHNDGKPNWKRNDPGFNGKGRFKKNHPNPRKKNEKGNKSQNKVDVLKKNEEYSHLVNSTKLTVFDWDSTIVLRNLPAQVDAVIKSIQKVLGEISIKKFCPIKQTFKSKAFVTLACVLNNKTDVDNAIAKLINLKVGDYRVIVSRFVKPHSFISNAFTACIFNFPDNASEKHLCEILENCGVVNSLEVEYTENGAVKKALVNLTNPTDLASLLHKDGMQLNSACIKVVPLKASCSVIVGNVHQKVSNDKLGKIFGGNALLVQKMSNMAFQIFFQDKELAERALCKDGESVKDLAISVRPWSKKNSKQYKVFICLTGIKDQEKASFDVNEFLLECGKLCSITQVKKNKTFMVTFESKDGQKAALQLNGSTVNGSTVEVTKKRSSAEKTGTKSTEQKVFNERAASTPNVSSIKNHIRFE